MWAVSSRSDPRTGCQGQLPRLLAAGRPDAPARVVFVARAALRAARPSAAVADGPRGAAAAAAAARADAVLGHGGSHALAALVASAQQAVWNASRAPALAFAVDPGPVAPDAAGAADGADRALAAAGWPWSALLLRAPAQGAAATLHALLAREARLAAARPGPLFFANGAARAPARALGGAFAEPGAAEAAWRLSSELVAPWLVAWHGDHPYTHESSFWTSSSSSSQRTD